MIEYHQWDHRKLDRTRMIDGRLRRKTLQMIPCPWKACSRPAVVLMSQAGTPWWTFQRTLQTVSREPSKNFLEKRPESSQEEES